MTNAILTKLTNLAEVVESAGTEATRAYGPKLRAAAEEVEHKLDAWVSEVDRWVESHFHNAVGAAREKAGAEYRLVVTKAHELIDEAKQLHLGA